MPYTSPPELRASRLTSSKKELGGAVLHGDIINAYLGSTIAQDCGISNEMAAVEVFPSRDEYERCSNIAEPPIAILLHELSPFSTDTFSEKGGAWRISRFFGLITDSNPGDQTRQKAEELGAATREAMVRLFKRVQDTSTPRLVIINDRDVVDESRYDKSAHAHLNEFLESLGDIKPLTDTVVRNTLVMWHTRGSMNGNPFYALMRKCDLQRVTIPVVSHLCLRELGLELRFDCSYELSVKVLLESLHNEHIQRLLEFPHTIIRFEYGVMHITAQDGKLLGVDIHGFIDGPYNYSPKTTGVVTGTTPMFMCAMVGEIMRHSKQHGLANFLEVSKKFTHPTVLHSTPLDRAIDVGLLLARHRFRVGFGASHRGVTPALAGTEGSKEVFRSVFETFAKVYRMDDQGSVAVQEGEKGDQLTRYSLPTRMLAVGSPIADLDAYLRVSCLSDTSIVENVESLSADSRAANERGNAERALLRSITVNGLSATLTRRRQPENLLAEPSVLCPFVRFGGYTSVDAKEIDSLLGLRYLVAHYAQHVDLKQPLSIGVFGKPGSGKSTAVRSALSTIPEVHFHDALVVNLSQISGPDELQRYFHMMKDVIASGKIPVAFFDEFDGPLSKEPYGWLRYFLMPMQDGKYIQGSGTFDLNRAVLVFAGGLNHTYKEFEKSCPDHPDQKAPDFRSRLKGFLDIPDIALPGIKRGNDPLRLRRMAVKARRAVMLRRILSELMPHIFDANSQTANVQPQIVDALLSVSQFKNGVRSMRAIIEMSRVPQSQSTFQVASLPSHEQIAIHVDPVEFFNYIKEV